MCLWWGNSGDRGRDPLWHHYGLKIHSVNILQYLLKIYQLLQLQHGGEGTRALQELGEIWGHISKVFRHTMENLTRYLLASLGIRWKSGPLSLHSVAVSIILYRTCSKPVGTLRGVEETWPWLSPTPVAHKAKLLPRVRRGWIPERDIAVGILPWLTGEFKQAFWVFLSQTGFQFIPGDRLTAAYSPCPRDVKWTLVSR